MEDESLADQKETCFPAINVLFQNGDQQMSDEADTSNRKQKFGEDASQNPSILIPTVKLEMVDDDDDDDEPPPILSASFQATSSRRPIFDDKAKPKFRKRYFSLAEKLIAVELAERTSIDEAALELNVDRKNVKDWCKSKEKLSAACRNFEDGHRKRQRGGGKKILSGVLEKHLCEWVVQEISSTEKPKISWRILKRKAVEIFEDLKSRGLVEAEVFKGSNGWLEKFLKRHSAELNFMKLTDLTVTKVKTELPDDSKL